MELKLSKTHYDPLALVPGTKETKQGQYPQYLMILKPMC